MPDFWPIQLETGALPNVPFPPITLVFICLSTSRKLLSNFFELLNYRVWRGDTNLGDHLIKHKNNASYISKSTQNDLTKCSNKEQMSLVLRYVDKKNNIREGSIYPL